MPVIGAHVVVCAGRLQYYCSCRSKHASSVGWETSGAFCIDILVGYVELMLFYAELYRGGLPTTWSMNKREFGQLRRSLSSIKQWNFQGTKRRLTDSICTNLHKHGIINLPHQYSFTLVCAGNASIRRGRGHLRIFGRPKVVAI
jgi:hypothetical protein